MQARQPFPFALAVFALVGCGGGTGDVPAATGAVSAFAAVLPPPPALPPASAPSSSGTFTCRNVSVGAASLDTVVVPEGAACVLTGTRLIGSIKLERGALLDARGVRVNGNLQGQGASSVLLGGTSTIGGSVQLEQGGAATIVGAQVTGDIQLFANRGALLAQDNRVGGNIQVMDNTGGVTLNTNVANGNLQCKQNQPAPVGGGNRAASLEDQCATLGGGTAAPPPSGGTPPTQPPAGTPPALPPVTVPDSGGTFTCRNVAIGAQSIDTVFVPAGATCALAGTRLIGSILIDRGASVDARDVQVNGNLQADGAASVVVAGGSRFGGSVQIKQGNAASIVGASITGDLQFDANSELLWAQDNRVGGNIQAFGNRGGVVLNTNAANGNLQCKENVPTPSGGGNRAASKEDQCRAL